MAVQVPSKIPARLEHRSHGRVRVRVPRQHRTTEALQRVQAHLESHPSVGQVAVNARTGSVLVEGGHTDALHAALQDVLEILESGSPEEGTEAGVDVAVNVVRRLDRQLGELTGGTITVRWLVPTTFIAVGLRQLLADGLTIGAVPWYVLMYYGVDAFLKLYPQHAPQTPARPKLEVVGDSDA